VTAFSALLIVAYCIGWFLTARMVVRDILDGEGSITKAAVTAAGLVGILAGVVWPLIAACYWTARFLLYRRREREWERKKRLP